MAVRMTTWSRDLALCTDGPAGLRAEDFDLLDRIGVVVRTERILRLEGPGGFLEHVVFRGGPTLARSALFFNTDQHQHSRLAETLRCEFNEKGGPQVGKHECTSVPGSTSRATRRGTSSSSSSPPPRGRSRPSGSTPR
jgi:hypothetical protein